MPPTRGRCGSTSWVITPRSTGDLKAAAAHFKAAAAQSPECCFPSSLHTAARAANGAEADPSDARAAFYLGNLWYDKRQVAEATALWERSRRVDPAFPTVHRNLALAYFNKQQRPAKALIGDWNGPLPSTGATRASCSNSTC